MEHELKELPYGDAKAKREYKAQRKRYEARKKMKPKKKAKATATGPAARGIGKLQSRKTDLDKLLEQM
jgi:hypothetical protein